MSWMPNLAPYGGQDFIDEGYIPPRSFSVLSNTQGPKIESCTNTNNSNGSTTTNNNNSDNVADLYVRDNPFSKDNERLLYPSRPHSTSPFGHDFYRPHLGQTLRCGGYSGGWTQDAHIQDVRSQEWIERNVQGCHLSHWPQPHYHASNLVLDESSLHRPRSRTPHLVVDVSMDRPDSRDSERTREFPEISTNSLGIPDIELAQLSVKDLNKKLQHLPRDEIRKIKEKRRTLKNRGYAANCRIKRNETKERLQHKVDELERLKQKLVRERDIYKLKYEKLQQEKDQRDAMEAAAAAWRLGNVTRDEKPISTSTANSVSMMISGSLDGFPVDHAGPQLNGRHHLHQTLHLDLSIRRGGSSPKRPEHNMEKDS